MTTAKTLSGLRRALPLCALLTLAAAGCSSGGDEGVEGDASALDVAQQDGALLGDATGDAAGSDVASADGTSADGTSADGASADATTADTGPCTGAVGCPCVKDSDCDTGLCVGEAGSGLCGTDCAQGCDDANPCTTDLCEAATVTDAEPACKHSPAKDGGACDDGNPCTESSTCTGGACAGGDAKDCDDQETCTTDYCDPKGNCAHTPADKKPCDDDDVCTVGDACKGGACVSGAGQACADSNPCTTDSCDPKKGCVNADADGAKCDDGDACTGAADGDTCKGGACLPGQATSCDDGDPCTADGCASDKGCLHTATAGAPCSDGSVCTVGDVCGAKGCTPGKAQPCDDGNPCTDNACDPLKGCETKPNSADCSDSNACTVGDSCGQGACLPGQVTSCDDGNPCTTDGCDPGTASQAGGCVNKAADGGACVPQDDSCAVTGVCTLGACKQVAAKGCDDGNPCTADTCDAASGACVYKPGAVGVTCDDGNPCTEKDACGAKGCTGAAKSCDDGNACTADACDASSGCVNSAAAGVACTDGDLCTSNDTCKSGKCVAGATLSCDDGNLCTDDSCDGKKGCVNAPNTKPCDDNNGCTEGDKCGLGAGGVATCTPGAAKSCDDGKHCTKDYCDPKGAGGKGACVSGPDNGLGCDDGDVCTEGDVCQKGACTSGPAQLCNDDNVCTKDGCDAKKGCVTTAVPGACNDGDVCTLGDVCATGKCKPGKAKVCNDDNACTVDSCHYLKGCVFTALTGACNDGDACTQGDACKAGKCAGTTPTKCDDGNVCTNDSCDKLKGCQVKANTLTCDDGNVCSLGDACAGGTCKSGAKAKVCKDGKVCTADECDPKKGCVYPANAAECSDGNACTNNDQCDNFKCVSGPKLVCDDHNLCTDDSCSVATGCVHKPNSHPAFKALKDDTSKNSGLWAVTASDNKPKWVFKGSYWHMDNALYTTQYFTLKAQLDLSCATEPVFYYEARSYGADQRVEVSLDGSVWTTLTYRTATDYVWRRRAVDLSGYTGKKVNLRVRSSPSNSTYWLDLRRFDVKEREAPPKLLTWGAPLSCADIKTEGPTFKCVPVGQSYELRALGVNATPPAYKSANTAIYNVRLDRSKVALPRIAFEERHRYASLSIRIRADGAASWQTVWTRSGGATTDYVWRKRYIDLGHVPGKVWEVAFVTSYGNYQNWADLRGVTFTTTPTDLTPVKPPQKWKGCKNVDVEGDAWTCDPTGKVYDYRYNHASAGAKPTYNAWHYVTPLRQVDLTTSTNPVVNFTSRYYRGYLYAQASTDGVVWTTVASHGSYGSSDYVWRRYTGSLAAYKGKKIWVRLAARPVYSSSVWGEIRDFEVVEAPKAYPVVKWPGSKITCADWELETPWWSCDAKTNELHLKGTKDTPSPNGYWQGAIYQKTLDLKGVSKPALRFERWVHYGELNVQVRKKGGGWVTLMSQGNSNDQIWRLYEVDLSSYANQQIELRFNAKPNYNGQYEGLKIRNVVLGSLLSYPVLKFGAKTTCNLWRTEGSALACDPKEAKWTWKADMPTDDGSQNFYHRGYLNAWVDLAGTSKPQLYLERSSAGAMYFWLQVGTAGKGWTNIEPSEGPKSYSIGTQPYRKVLRYDLGNFVGEKVRLRFNIQPRNHTYWAELDKFSWRELDKTTTVKPPQTLGAKDFTPEGSWAYDAKTGAWGGDHTYKNYYQDLVVNKAFDLSGSTKPELRFESKGQYGYETVEVSLDNVQWSTAWSRTLHGKPHNADFEPVAVSLASWAGQKQVFLRFHYYPYNYSTGHWQVRKVAVGEQQLLSVVKAPVTLTTAHLNLLGRWKYNSQTSVYSLNNPKEADIAPVVAANHILWPSKALDLSALSTPELTFRAQRYNATASVQVSADNAKTWQTLPFAGTQSNVYWKFHSVDLSAYKGHKSLLLRFVGRPGNAAYWWQLGDLRVANREVYPTVAPGTVAAQTKWKLEPGWAVGSDHIERKGDPLGHYTYAYLKLAYNLKTANKPKLKFEENTSAGVTRYYDVSDDGVIWTQVYGTSGNTSGKWVAREVALDAYGGSPTIYVRTRQHLGNKTYFAKLRKLQISKN